MEIEFFPIENDAFPDDAAQMMRQTPLLLCVKQPTLHHKHSAFASLLHTKRGENKAQNEHFRLFFMCRFGICFITVWL